MSTARAGATSVNIRRTALEMFASEGYDATSIRDIAANVGIRGASMYNHFTSKEAILWDLTQSALQSLAAYWHEEQKQLVAASDPESKLRAFVRSSVRFHAENRTAARVVNSQLHRLAPDHYAQAVKRRYAYEQELTRIVEECLHTGRHSVPDKQITVFAILQMTAAIAGWFDPAGPLTVDELSRVYAQLALKLLTPDPSEMGTRSSARFSYQAGDVRAAEPSPARPNHDIADESKGDGAITARIPDLPTHPPEPGRSRRSARLARALLPQHHRRRAND